MPAVTVEDAMGAALSRLDGIEDAVEEMYDMPPEQAQERAQALLKELGAVLEDLATTSAALFSAHLSERRGEPRS